MQTPPDVSQTVNRRDIWKIRPFEIPLDSSSCATADTSSPKETPYHYFSVYFNDEFLEKVTEYTNRYHVAEKGKALGASVAEMKIFFWYCHWHGLHLLSKATHVLGENHKTSYCS